MKCSCSMFECYICVLELLPLINLRGSVTAYEIYQVYICNVAVNGMFMCDHTCRCATGGGGDVGASVTNPDLNFNHLVTT